MIQIVSLVGSLLILAAFAANQFGRLGSATLPYVLLNLVGSDRIVVGTDSFNARDIEYPSAVVDQFKLPAVDRERILRGNAIRLFRLEAAVRRA